MECQELLRNINETLMNPCRYTNMTIVHTTIYNLTHARSSGLFSKVFTQRSSLFSVFLIVDTNIIVYANVLVTQTSSTGKSAEHGPAEVTLREGKGPTNLRCGDGKERGIKRSRRNGEGKRKRICLMVQNLTQQLRK